MSTVAQPRRSSREAASAAASAAAWESLFRAQVAIVRQLAHDDVWDEISMKEYDVLFTLSRGPAEGLRLKDLNSEVLLSQPSLSRLVDRLAVRGLVAREAVVDDLRGTRVVLTNEGRALQRRVGRRHVGSIDAAMGGVLTPAELSTLAELCDRLRAHVGPVGATPLAPIQEDLS
ncbi:MarR family winged helix-turn-helix transcriptional regulator [Sanguibacter sp. A247]|uniref:MarR family winged helix-turn-helix transcriptional regulator n=1 Tax=unclassified Sanguibacter TaxID=2645534 RepID=UPI003FD71890